MLTVKITAKILQQKFNLKTENEDRIKKTTITKKFKLNGDKTELLDLIEKIRSECQNKSGKTLVFLEGEENLGKTTFLKSWKHNDLSAEGLNFFAGDNINLRSAIKNINSDYKNAKFKSLSPNIIEKIAKQYLNLHNYAIVDFASQHFEKIKLVLKDESINVLLIERSPLSVKYYHEKWLSILNKSEMKPVISGVIEKYFLNSTETEPYFKLFKKNCENWIKKNNTLVIVTFEQV